jgi:predicted transcriptional regulator
MSAGEKITVVVVLDKAGKVLFVSNSTDAVVTYVVENASNVGKMESTEMVCVM